MKPIVALTMALLATVMLECSAKLSSAKLDRRWTTYKRKHRKRYSTDQKERHRQKMWLNNLEAINEHNKLYLAGKSTFFLGETKYADLNNTEYKQILLTLKGAAAATTSSGGRLKALKGAFRTDYSFRPTQAKPLPASVDWIKKGAVTPAKDQGRCGSCWTYSAVAALEGQLFIKSNIRANLSEQQLLDCVTNSWGCDGGFMTYAFEYLAKTGLENNKTYPYQGVQQTCQHSDDKKSVMTKLSGYMDIKSCDEISLQGALAFFGPVSVGVDASHRSFQLYAGGLYNEPACGNTTADLDHGVAVVGYGTVNKKDYYVIKNSWTSSWGAGGFMYLPRNANNACGVACLASVPIYNKP